MLRARQCLDEIVDLYQSGPNEKVSELLERVADLYFVTLDQQSQDDRDAFGDVMERMVFDTDALTRARLSERISKAQMAPIELIRRLARDEIFVARPVLQYSPCLREGDLVLISSDAEQDHLMATAHRAELAMPVTDIIVQRGEMRVLKAVISNTGAKFSAASRAKLLNNPELQEELQHVLSARRDLAPSPITRLKKLAEVEFWKQIAAAAIMTSDEPDGLQPGTQASVDKVATDEQDGNAEKNKSNTENKRSYINPASEQSLVDAARAGKVPETVQYFSAITQLDKSMIEHCIFKAHLPALMVLCKAHSLASSTFTAILQLRENHTETPIDDTVGLMRRYDGMTPDTAKRIIRFSDKRRALDDG